jgi:hypothetical protein
MRPPSRRIQPKRRKLFAMAPLTIDGLEPRWRQRKLRPFIRAGFFFGEVLPCSAIRASNQAQSCFYCDSDDLAA